MAGHVRHTFQHVGLGVAEQDQYLGQAAFRQLADQFQAIALLQVQIADGDIHRAFAVQRLAGGFNRFRGPYIEHAVGIEHLVQSHQLKRVVFEDQDVQGSHG